VSIGEPGSGVAFTAHRLLAAAGLVDGDLQESGLSLAAAIQALQARTIDGFFWSGGVPPPIGYAWIRHAIRSFAGDPAAADPRVYQQGTVAARAYPDCRRRGRRRWCRPWWCKSPAHHRPHGRRHRGAAHPRPVRRVPQLRTRAPVTAVRQLDERAAIETDPIPCIPRVLASCRSAVD
jgi:hypothetical protein